MVFGQRRIGDAPGALVKPGLFHQGWAQPLVAFNDRTGAIAWHDELPETLVTNAPISDRLNGRPYIVVSSGDRLIAYVLP